MSDFLAYTASDSGGLLQQTAHSQTLQAPATAALLEVDETQDVNAGEILFEELLLATSSVSIATDEEVLQPQEASTLDEVLAELPDEQAEQMAQQFLASLVNREVPMLMTATAAVLPAAAEQPVARPLNVQLQTDKAEPASMEMQPTAHTADVQNRHVRVASIQPAEIVLPKKAFTPATAETLRLAGLNVAPAANIPVISAGQPQAQVNAPMRADGSGQGLSAQLQHALGERLNLQINNQIQHATIRLDPPDMGRIEIVVQIEAGKIQVQINAGQSDVYRALQQVSNDLRQALTEQHFVDVDVRLSNHNQQQNPGQRQHHAGRENERILANEQPETVHETRSRDDKSILMTV
ncbi:flagellar hook-length control protein FliK [Buttiauxella sp. BIGb0552]|uniref:flagellar hook-length control protein FliK n=1 Tax=Buttiauxella sp. BIGb0552 TaxID=2485120 RepID=UPI0010E2E995|nr:flagellar hook-length control protein FliK [Buttiauxella sp. BIGb0552]TDX17587.1 flagellar hook-length control protein FliK [Buttiauxella sp. BIGb0552]